MTLDPPPGTRIAVVGGSGGIGRALIEACLSLDHLVTVLDLPASLSASPQPTGVAATYALDVTDAASVERAFGAIGPLDALVNLAGFADDGPPIDALDPVRWQRVIEANLTGAFLVAKAALPRLKAGRGASLVNVSSGWLPDYDPVSGRMARPRPG